MNQPPLGRYAIVRACVIYLILWLPALLLAGLVSVGGLIAFPSAPMLSAVSFLLALPAVLIALKSFRASAAFMALLLLLDIVTTTWPHIDIRGFFDSLVDVLLLVATGLTILVAAFSPFESLLGFFRHLRTR
jgi:hypothetical protein